MRPPVPPNSAGFCEPKKYLAGRCSPRKAGRFNRIWEAECIVCATPPSSSAADSLARATGGSNSESGDWFNVMTACQLAHPHLERRSPSARHDRCGPFHPKGARSARPPGIPSIRCAANDRQPADRPEYRIRTHILSGGEIRSCPLEEFARAPEIAIQEPLPPAIQRFASRDESALRDPERDGPHRSRREDESENAEEDPATPENSCSVGCWRLRRTRRFGRLVVGIMQDHRAQSTRALSPPTPTATWRQDRYQVGGSGGATSLLRGSLPTLSPRHGRRPAKN